MKRKNEEAVKLKQSFYIYLYTGIKGMPIILQTSQCFVTLYLQYSVYNKREKKEERGEKRKTKNKKIYTYIYKRGITLR